jgi:predicted PurR-regulated permease PerM
MRIGQIAVWLPVALTIIGASYGMINFVNNLSGVTTNTERELAILKEKVNSIDSKYTIEVKNINDKYNSAREELVVEITQIVTRVAEMDGIVRASERSYYTLKDTLQDQKHDIQELNRLLNGGY